LPICSCCDIQFFMSSHLAHSNKIYLFMLTIFIIAFSQNAISGGFSYNGGKTVIGAIRHHIVTPKETLLDVARKFDLGFREMTRLYPHMDPWNLVPGKQLVIPTQWVLPTTRFYGLVINLPEMRLYHFFPKINMVATYPVGIGDAGWETPVTSGRVIDRRVNPTWTVPRSLRAKYGTDSIPPGPNNPLGKYWIGLSLKGYGIHGTNSPWGVGRLVSHGCIRLYPEDIAILFETVSVNVPVEIVYEPVKIGIRDNTIFIEVHPDIYHKIPHIRSYTIDRLRELGVLRSVSGSKVNDALERQSGIPVPVGVLKKGGDIASQGRSSAFQ
jgi:L,D-transpeptidase ErfK/SrfK